MTSRTDAAGHVTSFSYDGLDRPLTVRLPQPASTSTLDFVTTYAYDTVVAGIVYTSVSDANGRVTKAGYDALGHVVRTVDALGNVISFNYQYNLLKNITDANGNVTSYTYDVNGNLVRTTYPDGAIASYSFLWDGTLQSSTDRRGTTTTYTRDGFGRITRVDGYNGSSFQGSATYTYDGEMVSGTSFSAPTQVTSTSYHCCPN